MSRDEARRILLSRMEEEVKQEAAESVRKVQEQAKEKQIKKQHE